MLFAVKPIVVAKRLGKRFPFIPSFVIRVLPLPRLSRHKAAAQLLAKAESSVGGIIHVRRNAPQPNLIPPLRNNENNASRLVKPARICSQRTFNRAKLSALCASAPLSHPCINKLPVLRRFGFPQASRPVSLSARRAPPCPLSALLIGEK